MSDPGDRALSEIERLVQRLVAIDRRAAVWCMCRCARTALHGIPAGELRPRTAIETAEAWVWGEATGSQCARAAREADACGGEHADDGPVLGAAGAAGAAAHLAARGDHDNDVLYGIRCAVAAIVDPCLEADEVWRVAAATVRDALTEDNLVALHHAREALLGRQLSELYALVSVSRWPRTTPTPPQLRAAPEGVRVAWDAVAGTSEDLEMAELVLAHTRAGRLDLDWNDPVQRAVAERADDEARVLELLRAGA